MDPAGLYDQDFLEWTQKQSEYLRQGCWAELDVENLVEELDALGRSEQRELGSYIQTLLIRMLKCQYQPERRTRSWDLTLANCRDCIQDCLEDTPSLYHFLTDQTWIQKYYRRACRDAAKETSQSIETFPTECPYTLEQILNIDPEHRS